MKNAPENNGLILNSYFVPSEILAHILSYVDPGDLINSRLVCKNWNQIITADVWKLKILASNFKSFSKFSDMERRRLKFPWHLYYLVCRHDPFEKNLLLNNCGQNGLLHWYGPQRNNEGTKSVFVVNDEYEQRLGHHEGAEQSWNRIYASPGNGKCVIEPYPLGVDPLPECADFGRNTSCFVTSYTACEKEQTIDLFKNGLSAFLLNTMQPKIIASEWIAGRFDCGFRYKLTVSLISSDGQSVIHSKEVERNSAEPLGGEWEKVSLEFDNYGPGVRFVIFNHRAKDSAFWAGFYGTKMAGGVVKVNLPNLPDSIAQP